MPQYCVKTLLQLIAALCLLFAVLRVIPFPSNPAIFQRGTGLSLPRSAKLEGRMDQQSGEWESCIGCSVDEQTINKWLAEPPWGAQQWELARVWDRDTRVEVMVSPLTGPDREIFQLSKPRKWEWLIIDPKNSVVWYGWGGYPWFPAY
jgi:hypothetical protein